MWKPIQYINYLQQQNHPVQGNSAVIYGCSMDPIFLPLIMAFSPPDTIRKQMTTTKTKQVRPDLQNRKIPSHDNMGVPDASRLVECERLWRRACVQALCGGRWTRGEGELGPGKGSRLLFPYSSPVLLRAEADTRGSVGLARIETGADSARATCDGHPAFVSSGPSTGGSTTCPWGSPWCPHIRSGTTR